jgi:hypothetical protein
MIISTHLETMHEIIGVAEQAHHHKNLGDLGIGITELLHGSGVKLESSLALVEGGDHHGNNFFGGMIDCALMHDSLILMPISL